MNGTNTILSEIEKSGRELAAMLATEKSGGPSAFFGDLTPAGGVPGMPTDWVGGDCGPWEVAEGRLVSGMHSSEGKAAATLIRATLFAIRNGLHPDGDTQIVSDWLTDMFQTEAADLAALFRFAADIVSPAE